MFMLRPTLTPLSILLLPALLFAQESFHWNGAGVIDESDFYGAYEDLAALLAGEDITLQEFLDDLPYDNQWANLDNWLVENESQDLVAATSLPTASDNVHIDIVNTTSFDHSILVPDTARSAWVRVTGLSTGGNRTGRIVGDAEFGRIQFNIGTTTSQNGTFRIEDGVTLTLTGGSIDPIEASYFVSASARNPFNSSAGNIEFTGNEVRITSSSGVGAAGPFVFSNPLSTIDWGNNNAVVPIEIYSTQTIFGLPNVNRNVVSADGAPLHNMSDVRITNNTRSVTISIDGGTYGAIFSTYTNTGLNQTQTTNLNGDITLIDTFSFDDEASAVVIRRRYIGTGTARSRLNTNGHRLEILSTGQVLVGAEDDEDGLSKFDITGSEVLIRGNLVINNLGAIFSDSDTLIALGGDFTNRSSRNTVFDLADATLQLTGERPELDPQLIEISGTDLGIDEDGFIDNFALGHLIVGEESTPTYAELVDNFNSSGSGSDALYVQSIFVFEGSVLNLNYLPVYTFDEDENLVLITEALLEEEEFGPGTILIPEPGLIVLAFGGTALGAVISLRRQRRSSQSPAAA